MGLHTIEELKTRQAYPLSLKLALTKQRIRDWVDHFGIDGVALSFSGGKDSTVLLDIAREMYPEMKAIYVDTGIEYPELVKFVKSFDNVDILKPKMSFVEVLKRYGYPMISKEVSECVYGARRFLQGIQEDMHVGSNKCLTGCDGCSNAISKQASKQASKRIIITTRR
jgi:PP-loop superfamily ATP-utilizing enzyme